jgi:RNA polymerase sigma factor (sigma-70 family)
MAQNISALSNRQDIIDYCTALHDRVVAISRRTRSEHNARDIAQNVVEQFLRSAEVLMAKYPDPTLYAAVRTGHAGSDFDSKERTQRCEGARLVRNAAGDTARGRTWESGDAPLFDGEGRLFDTFAEEGDFVEAHAAAAEVDFILNICLAGLTAADRELLRRVDGEGYTITQVAAEIGQRRETVNRRLTKIRAIAQANAAQFALAA